MRGRVSTEMEKLLNPGVEVGLVGF